MPRGQSFSESRWNKIQERTYWGRGGKQRARILQLPASRPRKMVPFEFFMLLLLISRSYWKNTFGRQNGRDPKNVGA